MPSIILSDNGVSSGSAGLKTTAASDGALALQTTTAGGTATTAVTIDTSQNVGIGTTSPSAQLHIVGSDLSDQVIIENTNESASGAPDLVLYRNSASPAASDNLGVINFRGKDSGGNDFSYALIYGQISDPTDGSEDGAIIFQTALSGTLTDRMRILSGGDICINTTTSAAYWSKSLTLNGSSGSTSDAGIDVIGYRTGNGDVGGISFMNAASSNARLATIFGEREGANNSGALTFLTMASGTSYERMRIDSSGSLLVGCTSLPSASVYGFGVSGQTIYSSVASTATRIHHYFYNANGQVGSISTSGSATAFNTSSDYRLKDNIVPMTGALEKVAQLKPCTYTWKVDGSAGEGFIAHELQEVVAGAVTGEKDAVNEDGSIKPQGIDTSFLVATLTAAIQELNAKVDAQAAEIAALKGTQP